MPIFLIVEPSPILRSRLHDWLASVVIGARVFAVANGFDALWLAAKEQPSHILIEMYLPDITAFEVIQHIRQGLPAAKIIATSHEEGLYFLNMMLSAGADGYVLKHKLYKELLPMFEVPLG